MDKLPYDNLPDYDEPNPVDTLRDLLLGPHYNDFGGIEERLERLEHRLSDKFQRVEDVSEIVAEAIQLRQAQDGALGNSLQDSVELALERSISHNPTKIASLLSPVFGQSFRQALKGTFQKEKKEAYTLEQIFLIHRETEYLLLHDAIVKHDDFDSEETSFDLLLSIREFMRNVHETTRFEAANVLRFGDVSIWIEWGPLAIVAAVVRGQPPEAFRQKLLMLIEHLHQEHSEKLEDFDGDTGSFDPLKITMRHYLVKRFKLAASLLAYLPYMLIASVLLAFATWGMLNFMANKQWQGFVDSLEAEPGIVVTSHYKKSGHFIVNGLQDPLAIPPSELLQATNLRVSRVSMNWQPYYALEPSLILSRAYARLKPPEGFELAFENGKLILPSNAPEHWLGQAKTLAFFVPGVENVSLR